MTQIDVMHMTHDGLLGKHDSSLAEQHEQHASYGNASRNNASRNNTSRNNASRNSNSDCHSDSESANNSANSSASNSATAQHPMRNNTVDSDTAVSTRCVVFGAGEYYGPLPELPSNALVIAADGGLNHARAMGINVDFVIGDFDSLVGEIPQSGDVVRLPPQKDDPDLLSALKVGWNRGAREFHIIGALGGRIDHTIANIQLLALIAQHGGIGFLYGNGFIVTAMCDGRLDFQAWSSGVGRMVSVFSHDDQSHGVTERGLKYELTDATLTNTVVRGLSNEFCDNTPASIDVSDGTLIVTFPIEAPLPQFTVHHAFHGDLGALDTEVSSALAVRD